MNNRQQKIITNLSPMIKFSVCVEFFIGIVSFSDMSIYFTCDDAYRSSRV